MKIKLIFILSLLLFTSMIYATDINSEVKPDPEGELEFKFPPINELKVDNGIPFYLIEDHSLPIISVSVLFAFDENLVSPLTHSDLLSEMFTKGTLTKSAEELSNAIESLGLRFNVSSTNDYLKLDFRMLSSRYKEALPLINEMINELKFDEESYKSVKNRYLSSLEYQKSDATYLANGLAKIAVYGENHIYGETPSPSKVEKITVADLKNFYSKLQKADRVNLMVAGDFDKEFLNQFVSIFDKYTASPKTTIARLDAAENSNLPGVYFIERPGAVQTSLILAVPAPKYTETDYYTYDLVSSILGGGIAGRLFRTLREKYSFTYSPRAYTTGNKDANMLVLSADVKGDKTDSSLVVIFNEIRDLQENLITKEEISRVKSYKTGGYFMQTDDLYAFSSELLSALYKGRSTNDLSNYAKLIENINELKVKRKSEEIFAQGKVYIIAVGDASVAEELSKYGQVRIFDNNFNEKSKFGELSKSKLSVDELINKFATAIGGKDKIENITDMTIESQTKMKMDGDNFTGTTYTYYKKPDKYLQLMDMGDFTQRIWFVTDDAYIGSGDSKIPQHGEDKTKIKYQAALFLPLKLNEFKFKSEVLGENENHVIMKSISPIGEEYTFYFSKANHQLDKMEVLQSTSTGKMLSTTTYGDYTKIEGTNFNFPTSERKVNNLFEIQLLHKYSVDTELEETVFYE